MKVHCIGSAPCFTQPWRREGQEQWSGSAFAIQVKDQICFVTNAHVVENATEISINNICKSKRERAQLLYVAHDLDLALLHTNAVNVPPLSFTTVLPNLLSKVWFLGFPQGGCTICATQGVLSRIDASTNANLSAKGFQDNMVTQLPLQLVLQTDATINEGSSGGPAFNEKDEVIGVASATLSGAQNVSYIIPYVLVVRFLKCYESGEPWLGVPGLGFRYKQLSNETAVEHLATTHGVLITSVSPSIHFDIRKNDVLLSIDSHDISHEGSVDMEIHEAHVQVSFEYLFSLKDAPVEIKICRNEQVLTLHTMLKPIFTNIPRFASHAEYIIIGGIVFTQLTMPLLSELIENESMTVNAALTNLCRKWDETPIVIVTAILQHSINSGIDEKEDLRILHMIGSARVTSMRTLLECFFSELESEKNMKLSFKNGIDEDLDIEFCLSKI